MAKSPDAFRTISEVADWLGVEAHVLRFWETRFTQVRPVKRAGGRRYYRPSDMALLGGIRKLLHEDGLTIRGVQKILRENGIGHVAAMSPELVFAEAEEAAPLRPRRAPEERPPPARMEAPPLPFELPPLPRRPDTRVEPPAEAAAAPAARVAVERPVQTAPHPAAPLSAAAPPPVAPRAAAMAAPPADGAAGQGEAMAAMLRRGAAADPELAAALLARARNLLERLRSAPE